MCDIKELSKEKDELINEMDQMSDISGAVIITAEGEVEDLKKKSRENIQKLSFLL